MDVKILQDIPPWEWPRDAGKTFLGILRDRQADASDRLVAADLAGDSTVIDDALANALISILGDPAEPEELRAQAAISQGPALELAYIDEFEDPDAVPISEKTFRKVKQALRKVYLDSSVPKLVRRRVLEAAVRAPEEWHTGAIRTAYASADQEWKLTAVFGMHYVRGFDKEILEALESADPAIHYEAIGAAGNWEVAAAWPHVAALVKAKDTSKDLLLAAIEAVSTIRPREAGTLLVDLLDSEDEDIVDAASEAMSMAQVRSDDGFDDELADDENDEDEDDEDESGKHETIH